MAPPGQSKPAIFKAESFGKPLGFAVFQDKFFAGKSLNLISACGYMGFNLLHLTTDQNVGTDLPVTLCNGIGAIFFWACVFTKLYAIVSLSCKSSGLKSDEVGLNEDKAQRGAKRRALKIYETSEERSDEIMRGAERRDYASRA